MEGSTVTTPPSSTERVEPREPAVRPPTPRATPDRPAREGADAVKAVAGGGKGIQAVEVENALHWLLEEGGDEAATDVDDFSLNFGGPVDDDGNGLDKDKPPVWVPFSVRRLEDDEIQRARKQSTKGNRNQRRRGEGEVDETQVARRMVAAGLVDPSVSEYASARGFVDPDDAVRSMFKRKPGLVLQVSGRILNFSGYDENDVREVEAGKR